MPEDITSRTIGNVVLRGFERMTRYRRARAMFVRQFVGQYYDAIRGDTGEEPINLIFTTIRSLVPNLVMNSPVNEVITEYTEQKEYAELLGLSLDQIEKKIKLKETLRGWVVDALFGFDIIKTSLAASGVSLKFGDTRIDPGQVYASLVDLDNFVFDPLCNSLYESSLLGDVIRVPRQTLLDTDGYDHDLVKRLPKSSPMSNKRVEDLSKKGVSTDEIITLQDCVDVVELWVPEAEALVTMPDPRQLTADKFLKISDYYGPDTGPYTFLSFTPPVPGNPLPVSPVSIWYDLHCSANRVFNKVISQSERQRDVMLYNPGQADEAQAVLDAEDGESVASVDPKGFQVASFGGQNRQNEVMIQQLQVWYNYVAGNPDQIAGNMTPGTKGGTGETATRTQVLQGNASIGIEDSRGILYDRAAEVSMKLAWYLHTDPLIKMPVTKRTTGGKQIQLWLTPEQRTGDFLNFMFRIVQRSMSQLDPAIKSKRIIEFAVNLVPNLMNAAMVAMQMGLQFNVQKAITELAKELDISEYVDEWFVDPNFQQRLALFMSMGPQNAGKAGQSGMTNTTQNGSFPITRNVMTPNQEFNQNAQMGSAPSQAATQGV